MLPAYLGWKRLQTFCLAPLALTDGLVDTGLRTGESLWQREWPSPPPSADTEVCGERRVRSS